MAGLEAFFRGQPGTFLTVNVWRQNGNKLWCCWINYRLGNCGFTTASSASNSNHTSPTHKANHTLCSYARLASRRMCDLP